jgi:hypothetical protein
MVEPMANDSRIDAEVARWLEDKPEIARLLEGKSEIARLLKEKLPVVLEGVARAKERVANSNEPSTGDAPKSWSLIKELENVFGGVFKGDKLPAARQGNRIVERSFPSGLRLHAAVLAM